MVEIKTAIQWMAARGLSVAEMVASSKLPAQVVEAILQGRYTPSPEQRESIAKALGVSIEQIAWGHVAPVEAMYGHGPQFGRSP
jgi:ribosome-binding protein aMBF1 (putative translation factor)